jgi:hypothetical protein
MVDLITVIPIFITYGEEVPKLQAIQTFEQAVYYFLFGLGTTRILRALRLYKKMDFIEDPVSRCLAQMAVGVSVMLLFSKYITPPSIPDMFKTVDFSGLDSAVILFLEKDEQTFTFHVWIYFVWVTLTFVGIGDIT